MFKFLLILALMFPCIFSKIQDTCLINNLNIPSIQIAADYQSELLSYFSLNKNYSTSVLYFVETGAPKKSKIIYKINDNKNETFFIGAEFQMAESEFQIDNFLQTANLTLVSSFLEINVNGEPIKCPHFRNDFSKFTFDNFSNLLHKKKNNLSLNKEDLRNSFELMVGSGPDLNITSKDALFQTETKSQRSKNESSSDFFNKTSGKTTFNNNRSDVNITESKPVDNNTSIVTQNLEEKIKDNKTETVISTQTGDSKNQLNVTNQTSFFDNIKQTLSNLFANSGLSQTPNSTSSNNTQNDSLLLQTLTSIQPNKVQNNQQSSSQTLTSIQTNDPKNNQQLVKDFTIPNIAPIQELQNQPKVQAVVDQIINSVQNSSTDQIQQNQSNELSKVIETIDKTNTDQYNCIREQLKYLDSSDISFVTNISKTFNLAYNLPLFQSGILESVVQNNPIGGRSAFLSIISPQPGLRTEIERSVNRLLSKNKPKARFLLHENVTVKKQKSGKNNNKISQKKNSRTIHRKD